MVILVQIFYEFFNFPYVFYTKCMISVRGQTKVKKVGDPQFFFDNLHKGTIGDILAQYEKNR